MRRYDDPVEVRRGTGEGPGGDPDVAGPEQFLWRGRLWKVYAVVAHWVETGPWWHSVEARAALGSDDSDGPDGSDGSDGPASPGSSLGTGGVRGRDLTAEREVWRVEAGRGPVEGGTGVFDLCFDWAEGDWRLARAVD